MNEITLSSFLSRLNERNKTEKYHRNENRKTKEPITEATKLFCQVTPANFYNFFEIPILLGLAFQLEKVETRRTNIGTGQDRS